MHEPKPTDLDPLPGSLEARLMALPRPAVPPDLERRLLANIPATAKARPRGRRAAALVGLAAAACLVAVVVHSLSQLGGEEHRVAGIEPSHDNVETSHSGNSRQSVSRRTAADFPDSLGRPGFAWPLAESSLPAASCRSRALSFD